MNVELSEKGNPVMCVGDVLLTHTGHLFLITNHMERPGIYRGVCLTTAEFTEGERSVSDLVTLVSREYGGIKRFIRSENLKIVEVE